MIVFGLLHEDVRNAIGVKKSGHDVHLFDFQVIVTG
jgi:hypothetical protein